MFKPQKYLKHISMVATKKDTHDEAFTFAPRTFSAGEMALSLYERCVIRNTHARYNFIVLHYY